MRSPFLKTEDFPKIKESNKGKFTKWAKARGMKPCEAAQMVMGSTSKYTKEEVAMANYANNFGCKNKNK